jgi:hypothetical protein
MKGEVMEQLELSTSAEAFSTLKESGKLGRLHRAVLKGLGESKRPVTGRELGAHLGMEAWRRLPELERLGRVVRDGTRTCSVTGRRATSWRLSVL